MDAMIGNLIMVHSLANNSQSSGTIIVNSSIAKSMGFDLNKRAITEHNSGGMLGGYTNLRYWICDDKGPPPKKIINYLVQYISVSLNAQGKPIPGTERVIFSKGSQVIIM